MNRKWDFHNLPATGAQLLPLCHAFLTITRLLKPKGLICANVTQHYKWPLSMLAH